MYSKGSTTGGIIMMVLGGIPFALALLSMLVAAPVMYSFSRGGGGRRR